MAAAAARRSRRSPTRSGSSPNGSCTFTSFNFTGGTGSPYYPPGFSNKVPLNGVGASVSYDYDGTAIPDSGYPLEYTTTTPSLGNGSATIKNG
jgi:hypothetical protein